MSDFTMNVSGQIVETMKDGVASFKVKTRLGFAFVWVYEEIEINFRVGSEFHVDEASVTFSDGYPIATIKPGKLFFLNNIKYQTTDMEDM